MAEAATGVMEANRVGGRPSRLGPSYHDQFAGAYAVIGVLARLLQAGSGTPPQPVEVGLYETGLHVASRDLVGVQLKTQLLGRAEREPHGEFSMPGYGAYQTADGRWIYLLMLSDTHWARFSRALEMPEASDTELATLRNRKKARERVEAAVKAAMAALGYDEVATRLQAAGFGFTEVLPIERVLGSPPARHPGKLRTVPFRQFGFEVPEFPCLPPEQAAGPTPTLTPPALGEHTRTVLAQAGIHGAELEALLACGAVRSAHDGDFAWAPVRAEG